MRRFLVLFFILIVGFVSAVQAQTPAAPPKPAPELKQLRVLVGHWTYEGEYKPGPLGPGGKITAEYNAQWKLGGFVLEAFAAEKSDTGTTHFLEVDEYNPKDKAINWTSWTSDGTRMWGAITVDGNTITWEGKFTAGGKEYELKEPFSLSADRMSGTAKGDISTDGGKTWAPWFEATYTKTEPAPKK